MKPLILRKETAELLRDPVASATGQLQKKLTFSAKTPGGFFSLNSIQ